MCERARIHSLIEGSFDWLLTCISKTVPPYRLRYLVHLSGVEPLTPGFSNRCSTTELQAHTFVCPDAFIPIELLSKFTRARASDIRGFFSADKTCHREGSIPCGEMVGVAGSEPATFRLPGGRATRLRYTPLRAQQRGPAIKGLHLFSYRASFPFLLVGAPRFELGIFCTQNRRINPTFPRPEGICDTKVIRFQADTNISRYEI